MLVKVRKESNYYLAYFIELRRIIPVNAIGAQVIDYFFNKKWTLNKIINYFHKKGQEILRNDVRNFLLELRDELDKPYQGGYPIIEKEQMDVPIAAELQIITRCNLRCRHCCQADYTKIMSTSKVKHILKILYKAKVFEIVLVGGEIFLHSDILKIISLSCEKYNFATTLITNGTLLNEKLIKRLSKFKNRLAFVVSLEGVGKYNDKIRGKGVFKKVDKTIKLLKKYGLYVEISSTINAENINHYQKLIEYSKKMGVPCNFNLFKPCKKTQTSLIIEPYRYFKFVEDLFRQRKLYNIDVGLTNAAIVAEIAGSKPRNECRATLSGLTINVEGKMVPCPFLDEIGYYKDANLPNLDKNFLNAWKNNYYFRKFRQGNLRECQACAYIFKRNVNKKSPYGISAFKRYQKLKKRKRLTK